MKIEDEFRPKERTRWPHDVIVRTVTTALEGQALAEAADYRRQGWIVRDCYPDMWDSGPDVGDWYFLAIRPATAEESAANRAERSQ